MIQLSEQDEQFSISIGATHYHNGCFVKPGDGDSAMRYMNGEWEYDTDYSDPAIHPYVWKDVKIDFSSRPEEGRNTQGEVYGNKTKQQDAILDALKELTAAYRRLGGLDCAYDKELLVAEAIIKKVGG